MEVASERVGRNFLVEKSNDWKIKSVDAKCYIILMT
jgi:hypothetical protein